MRSDHATLHLSAAKVETRSRHISKMLTNRNLQVAFITQRMQKNNTSPVEAFLLRIIGLPTDVVFVCYAAIRRTVPGKNWQKSTMRNKAEAIIMLPGRENDSDAGHK